MLLGTTGREKNELVLVPRKPTKEMIDAGWIDAHAEDAEGVWKSMIEQYEESLRQKREID